MTSPRSALSVADAAPHLKQGRPTPRNSDRTPRSPARRPVPSCTPPGAHQRRDPVCGLHRLVAVALQVEWFALALGRIRSRTPALPRRTSRIPQSRTPDFHRAADRCGRRTDPHGRTHRGRRCRSTGFPRYAKARTRCGPLKEGRTCVVTYFVDYNLRVILDSIRLLHVYLARKVRETSRLEAMLRGSMATAGLNHRQGRIARSRIEAPRLGLHH